MSKGHILITGGAGFIGANLANRFLEEGRDVLLLDNLSRSGVIKNIEWLRAAHGDSVRLLLGDLRDMNAVKQAVDGAEFVFHLAAQVAVTTSIEDPMTDFEINARGTLNLLEAIRAMDEQPALIFTSTNKTYGELRDIKLAETGPRYEPEDPGLKDYGISELRPLDFHSPYGCSKGCSDQYVLDYSRTFGLKAAVFRMSCIYGPHQFGTEDQGWVAHFLIRAIEESPITIYGSGLQVRDILFIDDLVNAFLLAMRNMDAVSGEAFNIGGGPANSISLLELVEFINVLKGKGPDCSFEGGRMGDQKYYVSDTRKFRSCTGWFPRVMHTSGVEMLYKWLLGERRPAMAVSPERSKLVKENAP